MADEIVEGSEVPDLTLMSDKFEEVSLSDFPDKNIVVYFYPKDSTPGCTTEAKDFTELKKEFDAANTVVIGISKDDPETHEHFKNMQQLDVILLSDENLEAIPKFGAWVEKNMYGKKYMGIERSTFLINKEKKVEKVWRKVRVKGHVQEVLEEAKKIGA